MLSAGRLIVCAGWHLEKSRCMSCRSIATTKLARCCLRSTSCSNKSGATRSFMRPSAVATKPSCAVQRARIVSANLPDDGAARRHEDGMDRSAGRGQPAGQTGCLLWRRHGYLDDIIISENAADPHGHGPPHSDQGKQALLVSGLSQ